MNKYVDQQSTFQSFLQCGNFFQTVKSNTSQSEPENHPSPKTVCISCHSPPAWTMNASHITTHFTVPQNGHVLLRILKLSCRLFSEFHVFVFVPYTYVPRTWQLCPEKSSVFLIPYSCIPVFLIAKLINVMELVSQAMMSSPFS